MGLGERVLLYICQACPLAALAMQKLVMPMSSPERDGGLQRWMVGLDFWLDRGMTSAAFRRRKRFNIRLEYAIQKAGKVMNGKSTGKAACCKCKDGVV